MWVARPGYHPLATPVPDQIEGDIVTMLIAPDGREYRSASPIETTRLKSKGYREKGEEVVTLDDVRFHPADHKVEEVVTYLQANPADANRVIAEEKAGKARATITEGNS